MVAVMRDTGSAAGILARIDEIVLARPDALAVIDDRRELTYADFWRRAGEVAGRLVLLGAGVGDRVAIVGPNSGEYLIAYFGIMRAGAVVVPLNGLLNRHEMAEQLVFADTWGCIDVGTDTELRQSLESVGRVVGTEIFDPDPSAARVELPVVPPEAEAAVLMSSGSTGGGPKGVVHTHASIWAATHQLLNSFPWSSDDVTIAFLPMFTAMGEQILPALAVGASVVPVQGFDIAEICKACEFATTMDVIPTLMARLLESGDRQALNSLSWLMFASEPMPVALLQSWWRELPDVATYQFYGMTEMLPLAFATPELMRQAPGSVGQAFVDADLRVLATDGSPAAVGDVGEVVCTNRARMAGYFRDPVGTSSVSIGEHGLRTGDLGYLDDRGRLFLTGRIKDVIISGGMNLAPAEIEGVAAQHKSVLVAAVIGVADERWGETPVVIAVPRPGHSLSAQDLLAFCRSRLSGYKRPSAAAVVADLPSTGIGKIAKRQLRRAVDEGEIRLVKVGARRKVREGQAP